MVEYDLTLKLLPYLDRHLVFPLLEFISAGRTYDENALRNFKFEVLSKTCLVDFALEVYNLINPDEESPEALLEKRAVVVNELQTVQQEMMPVVEMLESKEVVDLINQTSDPMELMETLKKKYDFTSEKLDQLFRFAKLYYNCGLYAGASNCLHYVRALLSPSDKKYLSALWGKVASEMLSSNYDTALEDLNRLREFIDSSDRDFTPLQLLQQRTWYIHWSLFVYFNNPDGGRELLIDNFLLDPAYLNAIQTLCPHVLRYVAGAVITSKRRVSLMIELVNVIKQESYKYRDPVTEFIECLFVNFDFDGAQKKLSQCKELLRYDFFLVGCLDDFMESSRIIIFETFCRIHKCVSISWLSDKLDMRSDEAEKWIVELIRNAKLNAKIDSRQGQVVMDVKVTSPYQDLFDKTKQLASYTQLLDVAIPEKSY